MPVVGVVKLGAESLLPVCKEFRLIPSDRHNVCGHAPVSTTGKVDFKLCISSKILPAARAAPMTDLVTQHIAGEESYLWTGGLSGTIVLLSGRKFSMNSLPPG